MDKENVIQRLKDPKKRSDPAVDANETQDDARLETMLPKLRPETLDDYPGQDTVKENLRVYVAAARQRQSPMDHVILHGAPGLGKTTLARILAQELGVPFHATSGPAIDRPGDLAGILVSLEPHSLLFIDEIHRLNIKVEEILYSALEDFTIDIVIGQGTGARTMRLDVPPFTLVGATTRLSLLSRPLLSRFGIQEHLDFYTPQALQQIVLRAAAILETKIDANAALEIARRSRGTPRLANRLLRRVRDFAGYLGKHSIDIETADIALTKQGVDAEGLDRTDRAILETLRDVYEGGPVGIETIAVALNEDRATVEEVYEPFLVYKGFLARTPRGRFLTDKARKHLT